MICCAQIWFNEFNEFNVIQNCFHGRWQGSTSSSSHVSIEWIGVSLIQSHPPHPCVCTICAMCQWCTPCLTHRVFDRGKNATAPIQENPCISPHMFGVSCVSHSSCLLCLDSFFAHTGWGRTRRVVTSGGCSTKLWLSSAFLLLISSSRDLNTLLGSITAPSALFSPRSM